MTNWVLVTGAGQRLGRAVAIRAASAGWNVAVHYRGSKTGAEETAANVKAAGAQAALVQGDLADAHQAESVLADATKAAGAPLTGLVNCAAIFEWDDIHSLTPQAFHRHMEVNALAPVALTRAFAAALPDASRASVVNFLDFKLASPYPDHFSYTLSKYALAGATEMLARALAPKVRVNAVAPGYVLPAPGQADEDHQRLHAQNPLAHGATAQDVADAVLFLLGAQATTGQTIFVDSGLRFQSHQRDFAFR
jgi:NAD(P)-dependent dehydrogenase (short-subunit alcohol dehydrogenase family)